MLFARLREITLWKVNHPRVFNARNAGDPFCAIGVSEHHHLVIDCKSTQLPETTIVRVNTSHWKCDVAF